MGIQLEGEKNGLMTIRVFYPNTLPGTYTENRRDLISDVWKISNLERHDPIYHELVFIDMVGVRHHIIGLPYHIEEAMPEAAGVDAQV